MFFLYFSTNLQTPHNHFPLRPTHFGYFFYWATYYNYHYNFAFFCVFSTLSLLLTCILFFLHAPTPNSRVGLQKSELGTIFCPIVQTQKFVMIFFSLFFCHMLQMCHLYGPHQPHFFFVCLYWAFKKKTKFFKKSSDRNSFA